MNGGYHKVCDSLGYGLPYATQYTNPFGYVGPNEGDKSDMVASYRFSGGSNITAWLD